MEEKKTFILAVPTLIIFAVVIIGIGIIFYNRNIKNMSKDDAKILAQKVATINNISCEVLTESSKEDIESTISDYKLCDGKLISNIDNFKMYEDKNEKILLQIDEKQKIVYQYDEYNSAIDEFETMICSVAKLLEADEYQYEFKKYETVNGIKSVCFSLSNDSIIFDIWLDKSSGMIVKMICHYVGDGTNSIDTTLNYRYQLNNVTQEEVKKPDLTGYTITEI